MDQVRPYPFHRFGFDIRLIPINEVFRTLPRFSIYEHFMMGSAILRSQIEILRAKKELYI